MSRKLTAGIGGIGGLGLLAYAAYFLVGMASGSIPSVAANTAQASLLATAGIGSLVVAGVSLWARHLALVVLAWCDMNDPESMAHITALAGKK